MKNSGVITPAFYLLPSFLEGVVSLKVYKNWLDHRSDELFMRDKKRKCAYALNGSKQWYKETIHRAVQTNGQTDPFTGEPLRWDLIGKWIHTAQELAGLSDERRREFALLPVVDHIDPYACDLELEICSWQINYCKSDRTPAEFVGLCRQVVEYCAAHCPPQAGARGPETALKAPAKYFLPDFLQGRCTLALYKNWLYVRARDLLKKDAARKRPYAAGATVPLYKGLIHAAVNRNGQTDPFTGKGLAWELIGTWDPSSPEASGRWYTEKYALLPSVDHVDPSADVLAFEICSLEINKCKSSLNPDEFKALCGKIVRFREGKGGLDGIAGRL